VLADDLRVYTNRAYAEPPCEVKPETQAVEICARAENGLVPEHAHDIGKRIWRIGDDKDERLRRYCAELRRMLL
jgi:hypothetical protein